MSSSSTSGNGGGGGGGGGGGLTPKSPGEAGFPPPPSLGGSGRRPSSQRPPKQTSSSHHRQQQQHGGGDASSSGGGTAHVAFQVHSDASTTSTAMRHGLPPPLEELVAHASAMSDGSLSSHAPLPPASRTSSTPGVAGAEVRWASDLLMSPVAAAQGGGGGGDGGGLNASYAGSVASSAAAAPPTEGPPRMVGDSEGSMTSSAVMRRRGLPSVVPGQSWRCLKDLEGDYTRMAVMPPEREDADSTPWIRLADVGQYARSLFCPRDGAGKALRTAVWKPLAGFLWFVSLIIWEILFGLLMSTVAIHVNGYITDLEGSHTPGYDELSEYKDTHRLFGAILGFVIGFRVNNAYQLYYEGRRIVGQIINAVREIVLESYTSLPKGTPGPSFPDGGGVVPGGPANVNHEVLAEEERYLKMTAREIRRLCMLTLAFIRQDVRESRCGFLKGTEMEGVPFDSRRNFYMDPVRPRLWDLLSDEELVMYHSLHPRVRPSVCVAELKRHVEQMCYRLEKGPSVHYRVVTPQIVILLNAHEAMLRIRDTPMPFPVLYVLHISTFVFVYSAPFLYQTDPVGCFLCVQLLVVVYYGLLSISLMIENPFRYASGGFSLPLEKFCKQIHNDTLQIARLLGDDDKSYIPSHLEPPPVDALVGNRSSSHHAPGLDPSAVSMLGGRRKQH